MHFVNQAPRLTGQMICACQPKFPNVIFLLHRVSPSLLFVPFAYVVGVLVIHNSYQYITIFIGASIW